MFTFFIWFLATLYVLYGVLVCATGLYMVSHMRELAKGIRPKPADWTDESERSLQKFAFSYRANLSIFFSILNIVGWPILLAIGFFRLRQVKKKHGQNHNSSENLEMRK